MKKIFKYFLAVLFHCIPRNKKIWITGKVSDWGYNDSTPPDFFDNSKYFYLYLVNNTNEKVYWISSSRHEIDLLKKYKLPFIKYGTLKYYFVVLRAKYFFHHYGISQIDPILQAGAIQIDFWHGTPLKKIRYDVVPKKNIQLNMFARFIKVNQNEYLASTSKFLSEKILAHAFDLPTERCFNFGYPRNDILNLTKDDSLQFCEKYTSELIPYIQMCFSFDKVFLYMPTWRDDDPDYFEKAHIDFELLNKKLKELNYVMFLKLHPLTNFSSIKHFSNIIQIKNDTDIYPFLIFTDFLITDYSSIYFDYLLLNKEIIFIPYDMQNYIKNRELYFEYNEITPGVKYNSFDSFIKNIDKVLNLNYSDERKKIRDLLISDYNFNSCENTYLYFKNLK